MTKIARATRVKFLRAQELMVWGRDDPRFGHPCAGRPWCPYTVFGSDASAFNWHNSPHEVFASLQLDGADVRHLP